MKTLSVYGQAAKRAASPLHRSPWVCWSLIACGVFATLTGCADRKGPDVQMVEGSITLDGSPLGGADVIFVPLDEGGLAASGFTREDGRYLLTAMKGQKYGKGAIQGEYRVVIRKMIDPPTGNGLPVLASPEQYASQERTPLRATVVKGRNRFDFALSSKGSGPKAAK